MKQSFNMTFLHVLAWAVLSIGTLTVMGCESLPDMGLASSLTALNNNSASKTTEEEPVKSITTRGPKKRIAVLPFEIKVSDTYGYRQVDETAAEMLMTALFRTGEFIVVERALLDRLLKEQRLGLAGFVDPDTVAEAGKVLGAQALVLGAVTHMGIEKDNIGFTTFGHQKTQTNIDLDIRVIDTSTARVLFADAGKGLHSTSSLQVRGVSASREADRHEFIGRAMRKATQDVAKKIVAQMKEVEWSGRVVQINGEKLYINAGKDLGLTAGHSLTVFRPGIIIKDTVTGELLGREENHIGQLLVTDVQERFAIAEQKSGVGLQIGDVVRLAKSEE